MPVARRTLGLHPDGTCESSSNATNGARDTISNWTLPAAVAVAGGRATDWEHDGSDTGRFRYPSGVREGPLYGLSSVVVGEADMDRRIRHYE